MSDLEGRALRKRVTLPRYFERVVATEPVAHSDPYLMNRVRLADGPNREIGYFVRQLEECHSGAISASTLEEALHRPVTLQEMLAWRWRLP